MEHDVVGFVRTDPDPMDVITIAASDGTIRPAYRDGPDCSLSLELERRVKWIFLK